MKNVLVADDAPMFAPKASVFLPEKKIPKEWFFTREIWTTARGAEFVPANVRSKPSQWNLKKNKEETN